jgi:hypothetical protein
MTAARSNPPEPPLMTVEEFYDLTGLPAPSDANGSDATISD